MRCHIDIRPTTYDCDDRFRLCELDCRWTERLRVVYWRVLKTTTKMLVSVRAPTPAEKSQNLARKIVTFALYMCSHFSLFSILYLCTRTRECGCVCFKHAKHLPEYKTNVRGAFVFP